MAYTTINDPGLFFNTVLYTGNGSAGNAISGVGFSPNMVWIKERNSTSSHTISDTIRGIKVRFNPDLTDNEETLQNLMTSFDADGFTNGADNGVNENNKTYAAWNWNASTAFSNDASATSIGTIDSAGSVNDTAGFSIVSYTGTGANGTVKHGLSTAPNWIIFKNRETDGQNWVVYLSVTSSTPADDFLKLNATSAVGSSTSYGNNTVPTTSVFSVGANDNTNKSSVGQMAYCWSERKGYSKMGTYIGNGLAGGPFVYTGFKPQFIIGKRLDAAGGWWMVDNKRPGYNNTLEYVVADNNNPEQDDGSFATDFLSNGFKCRATNGHFNADGGNYSYIAFADCPFVNSNGVPATTRGGV
jgi:hypothetical protein|tara:strand:+ start:1511 stop:2581 length:1071 start_codon:yes stop_codon:yes gene_type:complete